MATLRLNFSDISVSPSPDWMSFRANGVNQSAYFNRYLDYSGTLENCTVDWMVEFLSKDKKSGYSLFNPNYKETSVYGNIKSEDCDFTMEFDGAIITASYLMPILLALLSLLVCLLSCFSLKKIHEMHTPFFVRNLSLPSLTMMLGIHIQYFGVFMYLGLIYEVGYL